MGRKAFAFRGTTQIRCISSTLCQVRDAVDPIPSSSNAETRIGLPLDASADELGSELRYSLREGAFSPGDPSLDTLNYTYFSPSSLVHFPIILPSKNGSVNTLPPSGTMSQGIPKLSGKRNNSRSQKARECFAG